MKVRLQQVMAIASTIFLLAGMLAFSGGSAQAQGQNTTAAPGVWKSSVNIQNIGTGTADLTITFFNAAGTQVASYSPTTALGAGGSLSIYVPATVTSLPEGQYSAVVSSTQPVLVSINTASTNSASAPWAAFAYEGMDSAQAGSTLYFPGLYNNYYGFFSEMVIQNAGSSSTNLTAVFYNRTGAQIATANLGSLAPNASKTFVTSTLSTTPALPSGNSAGVFGAKVTSSAGNVVGIVNIWQTARSQTASYSGFTTGSSTIFAPALYNFYYNFTSALTLQNVSTSEAVGTITYSNGTAVNFTLAPGAAAEYYQPANAALPRGNTTGVFSAKVTTTQGSIVGLVSLDNKGTGVFDFASYNVPTAASPNVNIPNLMSDYYGYFSAVTVQNTGASATNVTITYPGGLGSRTFNNVPAGGTVNILHLPTTGDILPDRTSTSAVVSSSNGNPLVAVIQHNTAAGVNGHDPAKKPSDFLLAVTGTAQ